MSRGKETISVDLIIEMNVTCPMCDNYFDLIIDTDLNEEGWLLGQACPEGTWIDQYKKFRCEVECPECGHRFKVSGINW